MGQGNSGWRKLVKHPDKKVLSWYDELQVDVMVRDAWGDVGHMTVMVRRDDAAPERRWSATVFDHENVPLVTAHAATKNAAEISAVNAIVALGHSPTGYRSRVGKPVRDPAVKQVDAE